MDFLRKKLRQVAYMDGCREMRLDVSRIERIRIDDRDDPQSTARLELAQRRRVVKTRHRTTANQRNLHFLVRNRNHAILDMTLGEWLRRIASRSWARTPPSSPLSSSAPAVLMAASA